LPYRCTVCVGAPSPAHVETGSKFRSSARGRGVIHHFGNDPSTPATSQLIPIKSPIGITDPATQMTRRDKIIGFFLALINACTLYLASQGLLAQVGLTAK